jgi:hypothetical protein
MSTDARSGPDEKFNGLALCTLHHKLFDRGIFTLSDELNIVGTFRNHTGRRASGNGSSPFTAKRSARAKVRTIILPNRSSNGTSERFFKARKDSRLPLDRKQPQFRTSLKSI